MFHQSLILAFILFATIVHGQAAGVFGLDISSEISAGLSQNDWNCMRKQGNYTFAIIEGWQGGYGQNKALATAVSRAWAAGFQHVDIYAFMCPNCNNGVNSVSSLVSYLHSNNVRFGMIWMDIEQCNGCWNGVASNCEWVKTLANRYASLGINYGVYSSPYEWSSTVGSGCTGLSSRPLWYATYDGIPSFSDWAGERFGGWARPSIKQFADHADNSCGISIDRDWYP